MTARPLEIVEFEDGVDLLVHYPGETLAAYRVAPHDRSLHLYLGGHDVVGLALLEAKDMPLEVWLEHPDRAMMPADLHAAIAEYLRVDAA